MSLLGETKYKWVDAFIVSFNLDTKESLTLSARQTKIDTCANSVDLDGTETSRLIRIYTVCHSKFDFRLKPLFASVDVSMFMDERVHFRNSGMKGLIPLSPTVYLCLRGKAVIRDKRVRDNERRLYLKMHRNINSRVSHRHDCRPRTFLRSLTDIFHRANKMAWANL